MPPDRSHISHFVGVLMLATKRNGTLHQLLNHDHDNTTNNNNPNLCSSPSPYDSREEEWGVTMCELMSRFENGLRCSPSCYALSLVFLSRVLLFSSDGLQLTHHNLKKLFTTSLLLAHQIADDVPEPTARFASLACIPTKQLTALKLDFLARVQFRLFVTADEFSCVAHTLVGRYSSLYLEPTCGLLWYVDHAHTISSLRPSPASTVICHPLNTHHITTTTTTNNNRIRQVPTTFVASTPSSMPHSSNSDTAAIHAHNRHLANPGDTNLTITNLLLHSILSTSSSGGGGSSSHCLSADCCACVPTVPLPTISQLIESLVGDDAGPDVEGSNHESELAMAFGPCISPVSLPLATTTVAPATTITVAAPLGVSFAHHPTAYPHKRRRFSDGCAKHPLVLPPRKRYRRTVVQQTKSLLCDFCPNALRCEFTGQLVNPLAAFANFS